jgi:hypothetical protein
MLWKWNAKPSESNGKSKGNESVASPFDSAQGFAPAFGRAVGRFAAVEGPKAQALGYPEAKAKQERR